MISGSDGDEYANDCDVVLCGHAEPDRLFGSVYHLRHRTLNEGSSTHVCKGRLFVTVQRNAPKDSNLQLIAPSGLLITGTLNNTLRTALLDV